MEATVQKTKVDPQPGFYTRKQITNEQYHLGPGLSKSGMSRLLRSPLHFKTPQKETQALFDGEAFHVGFLEPERFDAEYVILPDDCCPGSGTGMKSRKEAFEANVAAKGQTIIKQETFDMIQGMKESAWKHPLVPELLQDGESELSAYCYDPVYPHILTKIRMDWLNKGKRIIVDLKSTRDCREWSFTKEAYDYNYDIQAAHYLYTITQITKIEHTDFYFICVDKEPPYSVMVYKASEAFIQEGLIKRQKAIEIYKNCLEAQDWPGYPSDLVELDLPGYVKRQNDTTIYN